MFQLYANLDINGHMKLVAEEPGQNLAIRAGGYMILMQEQDSFGKLLFLLFIKHKILRLYDHMS